MFLKILEKEYEKNIILDRNYFLFNQLETNTNSYLVEKGSLCIFIDDDKEEHRIRFGCKEPIIKTLDPFLTAKPIFFYIQALKKYELKIIS